MKLWEWYVGYVRWLTWRRVGYWIIGWLLLALLFSSIAHADGPVDAYPNEYYVPQNVTMGNGWVQWAGTTSRGINYYQCPRYDECGWVYPAPDPSVRRHEIRHWYHGYSLGWGEWNQRYSTPRGRCLEEAYAGGGYSLYPCGQFIDSRW